MRNLKMFYNFKIFNIVYCMSKNIGDVWSVSQTVALLPIVFVFLKGRNKNIFVSLKSLRGPLVNFYDKLRCKPWVASPNTKDFVVMFGILNI